MYLSNFEGRAFFGRKSAHMHRRACIGVAALRFLLMCTVSKMKQRQQTMLSFLSTAEKSRRQTGDSNFRNGQ